MSLRQTAKLCQEFAGREHTHCIGAEFCDCFVTCFPVGVIELVDADFQSSGNDFREHDIGSLLPSQHQVLPALNGMILGERSPREGAKTRRVGEHEATAPRGSDGSRYERRMVAL